MRWGVPRCEVLIAVGDQRCERVHMVRVLYHWNLIRLRERRIHRERRRETKKAIVLMSGLGVFGLLPNNYNLVWRLSERGAIEFWAAMRCQTAKPQ